MFRRFLGIVFSLFVLLPAMGVAQTLPNHFDPNTREIELDLSSVPAIRFLTTPDYPPFNYRDTDGRLIGFNIDLAHEICEVLEIACTMQSWPWEQAADALTDKQGDVLLAGLAITPQNGLKFDFSHIYLQFPARFVVARTQMVNFLPQQWQRVLGKEEDELSEISPLTSNQEGEIDASFEVIKPVAVRTGSNHQKFLNQYFPLAQQLEFDSEFDALEAVQNGEAFAYFGDALRSSFWLNEHTNCCVFAGEAYFDVGYFGQGLAAAFPAGNDRVRRAINVALFRLQREGVLDTLYLRWFPISFY